jgi:enterochelin esterase family protein
MIVVSGVVTFLVPDHGHRLAGVRLFQEVGIPGELLDFRRVDDGWRLDLARPPVSRMEYLLELRHADGSHELVTDQANPMRVGGAFGDKSVLEFSGYHQPAWLTALARPGVTRSLDLPVKALGAPITAAVWAPADARESEPLPLLLVHDGPEYDRLASLTRYLSAGVTGGWLPRLRAALLDPGPRDRWYSANARYARALRTVVLPALAEMFATSSRIGMGTSLGALAMLHAHCRYPDSFDALFLQSGSFFLPRFDSKERRFPYYQRVTRFVADVHAGRLPGKPVPATLTCGAIEENVHNNRLMAALLRDHGYPAELHEVADVHNYTAWRDAFDPYLTRLLRQLLP